MNLWQQRALALAESGPLPDFRKAEAARADAVACSGGADSLYLLLVTWAHFHRDTGPLTGGADAALKVLHFNHRTRGNGSDADAAFVQEVAEALGLTCITGVRHETGPASEAALRQARLAFFRDCGCRCVLQGHQRDDIAETLLMRLCRGSGLDGLAAPRAVSKIGDTTFVRPLLDTPKAAILEALRADAIPWREDPSNATDTHLRNRIRHHVLPLLAELCDRDVHAAFARSRKLLEEDADLLARLAAPSSDRAGTGDALEIVRDAGTPRSLLRRRLMAWLGQQQVRGLRAETIDAIVTRLAAGEPFVQPSADGVIAFDGRQLRRRQADDPARAWAPIHTTPGNRVCLPCGGTLSVRALAMTPAKRRAIVSGHYSEREEAFLDAAALQLPLLVRPWQPGDRYRPLGAPGSRKLQDCFTDRKIASAQRRRLPVVCDATGAILWVPGLPPSEPACVTPGTSEVIRLTYRG